jgi:hypothetical protein
MCMHMCVHLGVIIRQEEKERQSLLALQAATHGGVGDAIDEVGVLVRHVDLHLEEHKELRKAIACVLCIVRSWDKPPSHPTMQALHVRACACLRLHTQDTHLQR